jgi:predicted MPP superfamily phosphohydrolase
VDHKQTQTRSRSVKTPRKARLAVREFAGHIRHEQTLDTPIRVSHLTDLHVGRMTPMRVQHAAVHAVNELAPDVTLLTGDYVCHGLGYLDAVTEVLSGLDGRVLAVLGNHDHWSGAGEVTKALEKAGVEVLSNGWTALDVNGQTLQVVGVDDAVTGNADVEASTRGLSGDVATIAMSHVGEESDALWAAGVPFVLSGHTHGGQIHFSGFKRATIAAVGGHRYVHGLYGSRVGAGALYVNAGVGASAVPLRLGERGRREVGHFHLGVAPGTIDEHHAEQIALPGGRKTRVMQLSGHRKPR